MVDIDGFQLFFSTSLSSFVPYVRFRFDNEPGRKMNEYVRNESDLNARGSKHIERHREREQK